MWCRLRCPGSDEQDDSARYCQLQYRGPALQVCSATCNYVLPRGARGVRPGSNVAPPPLRGVTSPGASTSADSNRYSTVSASLISQTSGSIQTQLHVKTASQQHNSTCCSHYYDSMLLVSICRTAVPLAHTVAPVADACTTERLARRDRLSTRGTCPSPGCSLILAV
jgi:hypothetical protein